MRLFRLLPAAVAAALTLAAPALSADRKPLVLDTTTGRPVQIPAADTLTPPALKVTGITGSTQCLQVDTTGAVSGTGSACAGGGGTIGGSTGATDERLIRADGTGGATIQAGADLTLSDGGVLGFPDDVRQTFNPGSNAAGLNVGSIAGDPGTPSNGDLWYDSTANELTARINGASVALGAGGGGGTIVVNSQSGTSYTVVSGDQGKLVAFTNAANVAVTLPQATGAFGSGWYAYFLNTGGGIVTITPTTSTIGGLINHKLLNGGAVLVVSDGTNYLVVPHIAFYGGTSAGYSLSRPDGTATGGNQRSANSVDLQTSRSAATQVTSADYAFAAGRRNTASNTYAVAMGDTNTASGVGSLAVGSSNTASGTYSTALGDGVTTSGGYSLTVGQSFTNAGSYSVAVGRSHASIGDQSAVFGRFGTTHGTEGALVLGAGSAGTSSAGSSQMRTTVLWSFTSGATASRLTANNGAASTTNIMNLANNSAMMFEAKCVVRNNSSANANTYTIGPSLITRGANAASTAMSAGNPAVVAGPTTGTALTLAADPTFTADTTNGGFNVSYTPPVGNNTAMYAVCVITGVETRP